MGKFWKEFKKAWNDQLVQYGFTEQPGETGTGDGGVDPDLEKWIMLGEKFREIYGRDPYSLQEIKDWWNSV